MYIRNIRILIFFLISIKLFSQNLNQYDLKYRDYINKTINRPDVTYFADYMEDGNVDHLTGRFGISIPFYDVKTPYLTIPISLNYSTSGIKLDAVSNELGMDWNLIAGGQITRLARDVEDDRDSAVGGTTLFNWSGGPYNYSQDYVPQEYHGSITPNISTGGEKGAGVSSMGSDYINQFPRRHDINNQTQSEIGSLVEIKKFEEWPESDSYSSLPDLRLDTELDNFHVSAGKLNFSFVIKRKDTSFYSQGDLNAQTPLENFFEAVPLDDIAIKIKIFSGAVYKNTNKYDQGRDYGESASAIIKFEITDKDGIIYVFDRFDYTDFDTINEFWHNFATGINGKRFIQYKYFLTSVNKWCLTKIVLPNKEEINFSYIPNNYSFTKRIPRQHDGEYMGFNYNLQPKWTSYGLGQLDLKVEANAISEITYANQKVRFSYSNARPDYKTGGLNLNKIELLDSSDRLIKKFDLLKQYSFADMIGGYEDIRMFLAEIVDSSKSRSYQFTYNNPDGLPTRGKVEFQDLFGYYVGGQNPYPAFPKLYISPDNTSGNKISYEIPNMGNYFVTNGSDRSVKVNYPKFGTLEKITFPTGGLLKIEYENNTFYDNRLLAKSSLGPGVRVKSLEYYTNELILAQKKSYSYSLFEDGQYSSGELLYKPSFAYISDWGLNNQFNTASYENILYNINSFDDRIKYFNLQAVDNYSSKEMLQQQGISVNEILKKMIHLSSHSLGSTQDYLGREIIYKNVSEKITDQSLLVNNGEKRFYFKYADNRGEVNSITGPSDDTNIFTPGTKDTSYGTLFPFGSKVGNFYLKTAGGFIERQGKEIYPFPERNFNNNLQNSLFGKLEKLEYYNSENKIVYSEEYNYNFLLKNSINNNVLKNIKTGYLKMHQYLENDASKTFYRYIKAEVNNYMSNIQNFNGMYFFSVNQLLFNSKIVLESKTVKNYNLKNNLFTELKNNYSYSNQTGNLISDSSIGSNQDETKMSYSYPYPDSDYNWLNQMYSTNRISEQVGTAKYINNQLIETINKEYFIDNQGLIFLKSIKSEKGNSLNGEPEEMVQFKKYSSKGDLLEVSKANDVNIVYLYGYNKTEVVAKIENISYSSIPVSLINNIELASSVTGSETAMLSALAALRNDSALTNAMVTSYTYIPLIGVSTITDPKGNKVIYTYDAAGRLEFVKDRSGNILSENQYNYKQ